MKTTLTLSLILLPWLSFGQLVENLPVDQDGKLMFSEVTQVDGTTKDDLFLRSKLFFSELFKEAAKEAIKFEDKDQGIIMGDGAYDISFVHLGLIYRKRMFFSIKVESRDNRYRYQFYNIYYQELGSTTYQFPEDYFSPTNYYRSKGRPKANNELTLTHTLDQVNYMKKILVTVMGRPISEDW